MKHNNIAIFIPHLGCPNQCSFCNQKSISGTISPPSADDVKEILTQATHEINDKSNTEIAFFGGSFTAIDEVYMTELLETASAFLGKSGFAGIRISTRPDCIDDEVLIKLSGYGVTAIELGAQSMVDEVLYANDRGHSVQDVEHAVNLIRKYDFEMGLQMMVGLYKSTPEFEYETMKKIAKLNPDTVRIYPISVLKNTSLGNLYNAGQYQPWEFDTVIEICADMLTFFESKGIKVIRLGLHASETIESEMIAGFYHPAFRELVEGRIYRRKIMDIIKLNSINNQCKIAVSNKCISKAIGQRQINLDFFKQKGIVVKIIPDKNLQKYECVLKDWD